MFLARLDRDMTLIDGRRLCYTSYGQPDGSPVLVFEPVGLQLLSQFGQWPASRAGARLITPYRPGFGHSDPNPGATLSDWADDLRQLLDRLELSSVAVVAIFSSSVAALTAAHELSDRITSVGLLNPAGPPDPRRSTRPTLSMLVRRHRLARVLGWGSTGRLVDQVIRSLAPSDRNVLLDHAVQCEITEALRHGTPRIAAIRTELELCAGSWPGHLGAIAADVTIWHGTADTLHPVAGAEQLAQQLPHCQLIRLHNHGALWFIDPTDGATPILRFA